MNKTNMNMNVPLLRTPIQILSMYKNKTGSMRNMKILFY